MQPRMTVIVVLVRRKGMSPYEPVDSTTALPERTFSGVLQPPWGRRYFFNELLSRQEFQYLDRVESGSLA